eukprot:3229048-Ditylum_brightwellii.AAC.1
MPPTVSTSIRQHCAGRQRRPQKQNWMVPQQQKQQKYSFFNKILAAHTANIEDEHDDNHGKNHHYYHSHIVSMKSFNLAGTVRKKQSKNEDPSSMMVNGANNSSFFFAKNSNDGHNYEEDSNVEDEDENAIEIEFGNGPNLVAITGETGSGKSLLVARVAELAIGGKASASYLPTLTSIDALDNSSEKVGNEEGIQQHASVEI